MARSRQIKVLHLVTRMNVGGVAVLLDNLMSHIDNGQMTALLATGKCEPPEGEYLDGRPVNYRVLKISKFHKTFSLTDDFSAIISIVKILRSYKPDIVHTHTSKAGLYGRVLSTIFVPRAKKIHTFHGHLLVGYFSPLKLFIVKTIEKSLGLITDKFVAMGTQVRDDLVRAGIGTNSKFSVFFPGLVEISFPDKEVSKLELNLQNHKIYCTFIGRLTQIKRPDRVLEAAKLVAKKNGDVHFLIVGDGDLAEDLKRQSKESNLPISFLGWRQDIPTILKASDIALLTSDNEAVALTLIEASQAGIPLVTTSAGSVRDVALNGVNGFVTGFSAEELAEAILKLAENPSLRTEFGLAGKARSDEFFSIERMVTDHENLYHEILRH